MLTIRDAVQQYIAEKTQLGRITERTARHRRASLNIMLKHLDPEADVASVMRADARRMRQALVDQGARPSYANTLLDAAVALFGWIEREVEARPLGSNPFGRLDRLVDPEKANERRLPFTDADLVRIWPAVTAQADPGRRFVPELMLRLGLRPEEAAQLHARDVVRVGGVPAVVIQPGEGQHLKSKAARRTLPLTNPGLAPFRAWAGTQSGFLFGEAAAHHGRAGRVSEWFTGLLRGSGIEDRKKVLYSLRHTLATRLAHAGVPFDRIGAVLGHEDPRLVATVYCDDLLVVQHGEALGKLVLPAEIG